ncbi:MAG: hypothetical protein J3Q66DRAFT_344864 [Benniella sp.]|nr:MAG: hypothetical protein J3Q66DRAFT_344864 [Benniella sp.]
MPRPVAFSGALKRKQLRDRRARQTMEREERRQHAETLDTYEAEINDRKNNSDDGNLKSDPHEGRFVKGSSKESRSNSHGNTRATIRENSNHAAGMRLRSVFMRRSQADIAKSRLESMQPLEFLPESELEVSFESVYPKVIGFPKRPKWDYSMSRQEVEKNETRMFEEWMDSIYEHYPTEELSYFEHNLEVWRQLWRVLEISDIIMIIVDIRHPVIHFPPSLYHYVVKEMKRKLVVVFNKVDLVAPNTLFAWKEYFKEQFPELHIASFSCYPPDATLINDTSTAALQRVVKRPRRRFYNAVGVKDVLHACKDVELSKHGVQVEWDNLIKQYNASKEAELQESDSESDQEHAQERDAGRKNLLEKEDDQRLATTLQTVNIEDDEHVPHNDYVTIGLVGHPNVGKSSLINSIIGRTVVSTSRTPGHTKHFQTIHLTHNVRLCDSPGLVFPSLLPKPLQILSGMYPVAQVQEPYSVVQYLAMRVNLPRLLKLDPPPTYGGPFRWSAFNICEAYGIQRGFTTAKTGQSDVYRAANALLTLTNDGRILLSFKPPGFFTSTKYEQLRVAEADDASASTDDSSSAQKNAHGHEAISKRATQNAVRREDHESESSDEEESSDDDEDPPVRMNTRVGGFFGLLQEGEEDDEDDNDEDEDEEGSHDGDSDQNNQGARA